MYTYKSFCTFYPHNQKHKNNFKKISSAYIQKDFLISNCIQIFNQNDIYIHLDLMDDQKLVLSICPLLLKFLYLT